MEKTGRTYRLHYLVSSPAGLPCEICSEQGRILTWKAPNLWAVPFHGQRKILELQDTPIAGAQESVWCDLGFQGQLYDEETGLCYNNQRYYSPETCQYLSSDPTGLNGGLNLYGYVHNPLEWCDPFGFTGTYIFTDGEKFYIGKGSEKRMRRSVRERLSKKQNQIPYVHKNFGNDNMGLMVEHELMVRKNAVRDGSYLNKINSPGKKLFENADPETQKKVVQYADQIDREFAEETKKFGIHTPEVTDNLSVKCGGL